jgi:hypothetical protein
MILDRPVMNRPVRRALERAVDAINRGTFVPGSVRAKLRARDPLLLRQLAQRAGKDIGPGGVVR